MPESPQSFSSFRRFKFAAAVIIVVSVKTLFGSAAHSQQPDAKQDAAEAAARGKKQFAESCGFCHGPDATGARGPDLVRSALVAHDVKGELIGEIVKNGRPDKACPPCPPPTIKSPTSPPSSTLAPKKRLNLPAFPPRIPWKNFSPAISKKAKPSSKAPAAAKIAILRPAISPESQKNIPPSNWKPTCSIPIFLRPPPPLHFAPAKKSPASSLTSTTSSFPSASATNPVGTAPSRAIP